MNIVVCVKPVPDISVITPDYFDTNQGGFDDLLYIINSADMVAVEEALKIKEEKQDCSILIVSMTSNENIGLLRKCLAIGADEGIIIVDDEIGTFNSYRTGKVLAEKIKSIEYDLILCGSKAEDTLAGCVPYIISSELELPIVSGVTELKIKKKKTQIYLKKKLERGYREQMKIDIPCVISVDKTLGEPRYASLPLLIEALRKEIKEVSIEEIMKSTSQGEVAKNWSKVIQTEAPRPRPKKLFTPDSNLSAVERMQLIMNGGVEKKSQEVYTGNADELSDKFLKYLNQIKIGRS